MEFQNLNRAIPLITHAFKKNPHRSISATFRQLRSSNHLSLYGDYPILATITYVLAHMGIFPSRQQVTYALNQSEELHQLSRDLKITLLNQLLNTSSVATRNTKNSEEQTKKRKMNHKSSDNIGK